LGGGLGTCFDLTMAREGDDFRMWFSWRPRKSIAHTRSADGVCWEEPQIVLGPNPDSGWEDNINRPSVVKRGDGYHMWYTGQAEGHSRIGYATSPDGLAWSRVQNAPVLESRESWEGVALMCPHVLWDEGACLWRMWYSGGEQYEPDSIGYATSPDGIHWERLPEPVFTPDPARPWEQHKVTACQVAEHGGWHLMFYVGFEDVHRARICLARSRDGVSGWERHAANPILAPTPGAWDGDATYKPFAMLDGDRWLLWYNGRREHVEQIGLAVHEGADLGFEA
jgi:predicted GH43/DUF377 family glycosyl hydrolase